MRENPRYDILVDVMVYSSAATVCKFDFTILIEAGI